MIKSDPRGYERKINNKIGIEMIRGNANEIYCLNY